MAGTQKFGAGIWHFATYVDRYATDGYGDSRSVIDAIDLAGRVRDLSVVDLNYPFFGGEFTNEQVEEALARNGLSVIMPISRPPRSTPGSSPADPSPTPILECAASRTTSSPRPPTSSDISRLTM